MTKKRTTLTFYGGLNEIGGNKILLEDRDTRIFLDFGMSFAGEARYFAGYLTPRGVNGAGDYLEFDLLPPLRGLYAEDMIKNTSIKPCEPEIDAVILSHPHFDHVGYLPFIHPDIPVYCGECTKTIITAIEESSRIRFGEHKFRTFRTGRKVKAGSLEIEPVHVDHSVPGAYGFIIHSSSGSLVYTGDLRLHGPMAQMTNDFAEKAARCNPIVMISEGTRISPKEETAIHSEMKVKKESNDVVSKTSELVITAFYSRDVDRFKTFHTTTRANNRKFVIPIKLAHLLFKLRTDPRLKIPDVMKDETILFYKKRKRTGEFAESDYYVWERPFLEKAVNYEYIRKNQSSVVFNLDLVGFAELIDIKPSVGGHFIHSMSEPFSEEDIGADVMQSWLEHFGLHFHQIHASGHCPKRDLLRVINCIRPKRLIPIHTEHPHLFRKLFKDVDVRLAQKGKPIKIAD